MFATHTLGSECPNRARACAHNPFMTMKNSAHHGSLSDSDGPLARCIKKALTLRSATYGQWYGHAPDCCLPSFGFRAPEKIARLPPRHEQCVELADLAERLPVCTNTPWEMRVIFETKIIFVGYYSIQSTFDAAATCNELDCVATLLESLNHFH
mmetsp:Transcript_11284/g.19359  ORF Transcript_11284/g.19359 Transcript_11284/m.19359 type:complete len:154 (+) Transcript_11284:67-528(+)